MLRPFAAGTLSALFAFVLVHASGCGTDAVGIDDCRDIEEARCEAGQYCGLVAKDEVDACKRFYRDQCLHGLATGDRPGKIRVKECVATIQAAGSCAKQGFENLVDCPKPPSDKTALTVTCDVIERPELVEECDFLYKPVDVPDATPDTSTPDADDGGGDAGDAASDAPAE